MACKRPAGILKMRTVLKGPNKAGSLNSSLGSSVSFSSVFTCLTVQLASGAFGHIKDTVLSALNREPTMDISPETVGTLSLIMLAQAQEVIFLKATSGTKERNPQWST